MTLSGRGVYCARPLLPGRLSPLKQQLKRFHVYQRKSVADLQGNEQGKEDEGGPLLPLRMQAQLPFHGRKPKATSGKRCAAEAAQELEQEHQQFMQEALIEARKAASVGEVPVGAVMVCQGKVIARAHNRVEKENDPTAHAEMICIRSTAKSLGGWRLLNSTLYVTLEPCPMCAGAILQARIGVVVWGAPNPLLGADGSWVSLFPRHLKDDSTEQPLAQPEDEMTHQKSLIHPFNPDIRVRSGIMASECSEIMKEFFRGRRKDSKVGPGKAPLLSSVWSIIRKFLANHQLFGVK